MRGYNKNYKKQVGLEPTTFGLVCRHSTDEATDEAKNLL